MMRPADRLGPEAIGLRVTVRYGLADGRATDVVGILEAWDDDACAVRNRAGDLVRVPRDRIVASRIVRASRRTRGEGG